MFDKKLNKDQQLVSPKQKRHKPQRMSFCLLCIYFRTKLFLQIQIKIVSYFLH